MAILAALVLGVVAFFAFGAGAAIWMGSVYGSNSGGTEMSSFFAFGPAGGLAGILLGVGLVLRFLSEPAGRSKGLIIGAASLTGLAVVVLSGLALAHPTPVAGPPSYILVCHVELPAAGLVENPTWGFAGGSISSVEKNCSGDTCTFALVIALNQSFSSAPVTLSAGAVDYSFPVDAADIQRASAWSDWRSSKAGRFRYRINRDETHH